METPNFIFKQGLKLNVQSIFPGNLLKEPNRLNAIADKSVWNNSFQNFIARI